MSSTGTCEEITKSCHSERSEESAVVCFQKDKSRFFALLRMTDDFLTPSSHLFSRFARQPLSMRFYEQRRLEEESMALLSSVPATDCPDTMTS
jgi:hypothetical protein